MGRSNTTAVAARHGSVATSTRRAVSRDSRCLRSVSPSLVRIRAPLFTIIVSGESICCATGIAKSYRRPVTSATSIPRRVAFAIASRLARETSHRLFRSVPSISNAMKRIAIASVYRNARLTSGKARCCSAQRAPIWLCYHSASMATHRLYYDDSYLQNFQARVLTCLRVEPFVSPSGTQPAWEVFLDRTAFYPSSGGQPNDLGRLGEARILDVRDAGEDIAHIVDGELSLGDVDGSIDWSRRFD